MSIKKPIRDTYAETKQMYQGFLQDRFERLSGKPATTKVAAKPVSRPVPQPINNERKVPETKVSPNPQVQREYRQAPSGPRPTQATQAPRTIQAPRPAQVVRPAQAPRQVPTVQDDEETILQKAIEASLKDEKRRQLVTADEELARHLALEAYSA